MELRRTALHLWVYRARVCVRTDLRIGGAYWALGNHRRTIARPKCCWRIVHNRTASDRRIASSSNGLANLLGRDAADVAPAAPPARVRPHVARPERNGCLHRAQYSLMRLTSLTSLTMQCSSSGRELIDVRAQRHVRARLHAPVAPGPTRVPELTRVPAVPDELVGRRREKMNRRVRRSARW